MLAEHVIDTDSTMCQSFEGSACAHRVTLGDCHSHATIISSKLDRQSYAEYSFQKLYCSMGAEALIELKLIPASQVSFKAPGVNIINVIKQTLNSHFFHICWLVKLKVRD